MKGENGIDYKLRQIKEAKLKDGALEIIFFDSLPGTSFRIVSPTEQDMKTFVAGALIIDMSKGFKTAALIEMKPGYIKSEPRLGEVKIQAANVR